MELPSPQVVRANVEGALLEDLGGGDVTADLVTSNRLVQARIISREDAVLCGTPWVEEIYRQLRDDVDIVWEKADGDRLAPDDLVCRITGPAQTILIGERAALNFLQTLSGTATTTAHWVDLVADCGVRVLDTRKTLPGLRVAQKYAVRCGGGHNHRMGLYDLVLIKENHIAAAGSVAAALARAAQLHPELAAEIEVESLSELDEALRAGAKRILLDNFSLSDLREAVRRNAGRARLEASGGVDESSIRAIAETGVDDISVGALTKHVRAVDYSLRIV